MLNNFPSGVVWEDIEELFNLKFLSSGWRGTLARLLSQDQVGNTTPEENDENGSDRNLKPEIKPGNYFWIVIAKSANANIYFKPAQSVYQVISKSLRNEFPEWLFARIEYLTLFALTLIERAKVHYFYSEQLVENSIVSDHGIWSLRQSNYFYKKHFTEGKMTSIYLQRMTFDGIKGLLTIFQEQETNFLCCLDLDMLKVLLSSDGIKYFL